MVSEFFLWLGATVAEWFLSLFPQTEAPAWIAGVADFLNSIMAGAAGLGAWVPWSFALVVGGLLLATWLTGLTIKVARWILGLIPTMGGS